MIPTVKIFLSVKFRAFYIDFAKFAKLITINVANGFSLKTDDASYDMALPAGARKAVDQKGVKLYGWTE